VVQDLRYLVLGPAALSSFSNDERRGIDDTVLKPTQKSALAHSEQARH
jgi:hypothetical protein